ncbi:MAG: hypothetical protein U1E39_14145 [Planctomycetota bacterium]
MRTAHTSNGPNATPRAIPRARRTRGPVADVHASHAAAAANGTAS